MDRTKWPDFPYLESSMIARLFALAVLLIAATPAFAAYGQRYIDLERWDRRPVDSGLAFRPIVNAPVLDEGGRLVGNVADIQFTPDGRAQALIVRNALNELGAYAWNRISIAPGEQAVRVRGNGAPDPIVLARPGTSGQIRPFLASELIGDRARFDDITTTFGFVRDIVVSQNGALDALIVQTMKRPAGVGGSYAFPFYGYGGYNFKFQPASSFVAFPYNQKRVIRYVQRARQVPVGG